MDNYMMAYLHHILIAYGEKIMNNCDFTFLASCIMVSALALKTRFQFPRGPNSLP